MSPLTKTVQLNQLAQETILNIQNLIEQKAGIQAYQNVVEATFKAVAEVDASASMTKKEFIAPLMKELNELTEASPQVAHIDGYKREFQLFVGVKLFIDKKAELGLNSKPNIEAWDTFKKSVLTPSEAVEPAKVEEVAEVKETNKNTARPATAPQVTRIDFTKYIEIAEELLNGDSWEKIAVGLSMATYRRDVEVGMDMEFIEDEFDYAVVVSSPAKKREETDKYYRIPTLVRGTLVIDAVERLRKLLPQDSTAQTKRDLEGRKAGNIAWNNSENKAVTKVFNEIVRPFLKGNNSKDNKHQLRNIGTSFLIQLQRNVNGSFVGDDKDYLEFARRCLIHEFEDTTRGYASWNIENIPPHLNEILTYSIGEIETTQIKEQQPQEINDMATIYSAIIGNLADNPEAIELAQKVFLDESGKLKKGDELALALGRVFKKAVGNTIDDGIIIKTKENPRSSEAWTRLARLVSVMMDYNTHSELKYKIEIAASPIRSFYEVMFERTVNINDVNNFLAANESLLVKIDEHNKTQGIPPGNNLKWRKEKQSVVIPTFKTYIK
ncbi:protelomerase family protein [Nostoc sp. UIC 10890]